MRPIPKKLRDEMDNDPFYETCIRNNEDCKGYITREHALLYKGSQINEKFAILPVCENHHGVNQYQGSKLVDKRFHEYIAIGRMTEEDKKKYPRQNWGQKFNCLKKIYE